MNHSRLIFRIERKLYYLVKMCSFLQSLKKAVVLDPDLFPGGDWGAAFIEMLTERFVSGGERVACPLAWQVPISNTVSHIKIALNSSIKISADCCWQCIPPICCQLWDLWLKKRSLSWRQYLLYLRGPNADSKGRLNDACRQCNNTPGTDALDLTCNSIQLIALFKSSRLKAGWAEYVRPV